MRSLILALVALALPATAHAKAVVHYDPETGEIARIERDADEDGKVDRWDRDEERLRNSALAKQRSADETASQ